MAIRHAGNEIGGKMRWFGGEREQIAVTQ